MQRKKRLAEYIVEDIKTMLREGRLKEGDKLPNQIEFAKMLGVSRLSLREALQTLEIMGIVEQKPKTGTIIRSGNPETWALPQPNFLLKDEDDTRQMIIARACVEPTIAEEALKSITSEQVEQLTQIYYEMYDAFRASNVEEYLAKDKEFHLYIAESCGNWYLLNMYKVALNQVDIFMKSVFIAIPEAFQKTVQMHRAIYEALAERNETKLRKSVKRHSDYIEELILQFFEKQTPQDSWDEKTLYYP